MNRRKLSITVAIAATVVAIPQALRAQLPLGTVFTYQGQLKEGGVPVNDTCDFEFSLWDADSNGTLIGTNGASNVAVTDGQFTVPLDFGAAAFDGNERWLQVGVRCPAWDAQPPEPPFTSLSPRQQVTPTPYALQTRGIFVDDTGNVGLGTTAPVDKLNVEGSAVFKGPHPWVDVRAFGAKGDGVTPDTAAIQNAIDSLPSLGGTVFFPAGVYYVTSSTTDPAIKVTRSRVVLKGAGIASQLINHGNGDLLQIGDGVTPISNVVVDSLSLQHTQQTSGWAINVRSAPNTRIMRCSVSNESMSAGGMSFSGSWSCTVSNCSIGSIQGAGIYISASHAMWIAGNRMDGHPVTPGIGVSIQGTQDVRLSGNNIESWQVAIDLDGVTGISIDGCYFEFAVVTHVAIRNICGRVSGLHVSGCFFGGAPIGSQPVIDLAHTLGAVIQGNAFTSESSSVPPAPPIRITNGPGGRVDDAILGPNYYAIGGIDVTDPQVIVCSTTAGCPFNFNCSSPGLPSATVTVYGRDGTGVGTNTPSERLHVEGNIKASGSVTSGSIRAENPGELGVSAVRGISATAADAQNLRGAETFSSSDTATVTFSTPEPDASYFVTVTGDANETFWVENKQSTGFTIRSSNASSTATVNWILVR